MIAQIAAMGHIQTRRISPNINIQNKSSRGSTIPYFERNSFLKEEATDNELSVLHDMGFVKMTSDDLIETKAALNVIGYSPAIKLSNLMIEHDVIGFSRPGVDNHPHLNFLATLLPKLKEKPVPLILL